MEIHYIRKLMTSHMVIEQMKLPSEWEMQMIAHASLENVLFADCICEDGRSDLWYDITGKQSLDVLLEDRKLGYDLLCRILMGIYDGVEGVESILLRAESLLLMPESIFLDYERNQIYLCYCPGNVLAINEVFLQLMEYLLTKLNHDDERAVELAYGIYGQAEKSGWSLREIKSMVCLSYQAEEMFEEVAETQESEVTIGIEKENLQVSREEPAEEGWQKYLTRLKEALHERIPRSIRDIFGKRHTFGKKQKEKEQKEKERFVFEPEPEEREHYSRPTVLLAELTRAPEGVLRYEGEGACTNLAITGEEYLIGSDRTCAGYIPSQTVSRRHAKITRVDDIYFVEDLNSSNGTYVGGELLNYKTKISLHKNEVVIFADEKFRFI